MHTHSGMKVQPCGARAVDMRAVVLALSASLGAIGAFSCRPRPRSRQGRRRRSASPAAAAARRRHSVAAGGARWSAGRSGSTRASGCQPQSRGIECRTGSRRRARNHASQTLSTRRCDASFVAPRPSSRPWHRETSRRRVGDRPCPRAPRKGAGSTRGRRRARPHVPRKLQPDEAERSRVRRPRVGDGARAGEHPVARRRRARAGDL